MTLTVKRIALPLKSVYILHELHERLGTKLQCKFLFFIQEKSILFVEYVVAYNNVFFLL